MDALQVRLIRLEVRLQQIFDLAQLCLSCIPSVRLACVHQQPEHMVLDLYCAALRRDLANLLYHRVRRCI